MTDRHDITATLPWMRGGTAHLSAVVDKLRDEDLAQPSSLPGWDRTHVIGHVACNAQALARLAAWAATGIETPMYADRRQRTAEIEHAAAQPPAVLRAQLIATADTLDTVLTGLTDAQWEAPVRSALGRTIPALEVPWMRVREVWLHAVDLAADAGVDDLPPGVVDLLLDDVTTTLTAKANCPALRLDPSDRHRTWQLGAAEPAQTVTGTAADLVGWVTGRITRPDHPVLPQWI